MPRSDYLFGSALALGHVIFCFFIMSRHFDGSWGGFSIFLVDLPASLPALLLSNVLGIRTEYVLLVVGTAWWFSIGMLIAKLFAWLSTKTKKAGESAAG